MIHKQNPLRLALAALAVPTVALATPVPLGGTSFGGDYVESQAIARNASGMTALAWYDEDGAYFEMLDETGTPVTSAIQVANSWVPMPAVAVDDDGDAVVAWVSGPVPTTSYPPYTNNPATVYAQIYGPDGQAKGAPINVGASIESWGYLGGSLSVAMDPDGDFAVAWTQSQTLADYFYSGGYTYLGVHTVYARAFSADGIPRSDAVTVSGPQTGNNECSSVAMDRAGNFAVAWTFSGQPLPHTLDAAYQYSVQLQRYSRKGIARGAPILATQFDNSALLSRLSMSCATIAMNGAGDFSLAWRDPEGSINLQKYTPWTVTAPATSTVASYSPNAAVEAPVAVIDTMGQPGVIWGNIPLGDGTNWTIFGNMTIYGQWFWNDGTAKAPPFTLEAGIYSFYSTEGTYNQSSFAAATDPKGDPAVFWRGGNWNGGLTAELFKGF